MIWWVITPNKTLFKRNSICLLFDLFQIHIAVLILHIHFFLRILPIAVWIRFRKWGIQCGKKKVQSKQTKNMDFINNNNGKMLNVSSTVTIHIDWFWLVGYSCHSIQYLVFDIHFVFPLKCISIQIEFNSIQLFNT